MRLIKPFYKILEQLPTPTTENNYLQDWGREDCEIAMFKHIERIGRVCWKSEDKITDDSYINFIEMLKDKKHLSVFEHGTVYLTIPNTYNFTWDDVRHKNTWISRDYPDIWLYYNNKYTVINEEYDVNEDITHWLITTNYRAIIESNLVDDLKYLTPPHRNHEKRYSVLFTCDRGVSHEAVRNRGKIGNAFTQSSTRYCNYSKDKFDKQITCIIPPWTEIPEGEYTWENYLQKIRKPDDCMFVESLFQAERSYMRLINACDWKAQQARAVLPNALMTELVITGTEWDWHHFFSLRDHKAAHPQMQELAAPLHKEFVKRGYV